MVRPTRAGRPEHAVASSLEAARSERLPAAALAFQLERLQAGRAREGSHAGRGSPGGSKAREGRPPGRGSDGANQ
eukprot:8377870-Alexandrium_andersonii.AAC.1